MFAGYAPQAEGAAAGRRHQASECAKHWRQAGCTGGRGRCSVASADHDQRRGAFGWQCTWRRACRRGLSGPLCARSAQRQCACRALGAPRRGDALTRWDCLGDLGRLWRACVSLKGAPRLHAQPGALRPYRAPRTTSQSSCVLVTLAAFSMQHVDSCDACKELLPFAWQPYSRSGNYNGTCSRHFRSAHPCSHVKASAGTRAARCRYDKSRLPMHAVLHVVPQCTEHHWTRVAVPPATHVLQARTLATAQHSDARRSHRGALEAQQPLCAARTHSAGTHSHARRFPLPARPPGLTGLAAAAAAAAVP